MLSKLGSGLSRSAKNLLSSPRSRKRDTAPITVDPVQVELRLMNADLGEPATTEQELLFLRSRVEALSMQLAASSVPPAPAQPKHELCSVATEAKLPFTTYALGHHLSESPIVRQSYYHSLAVLYTDGIVLTLFHDIYLF